MVADVSMLAILRCEEGAVTGCSKLLEERRLSLTRRSRASSSSVSPSSASLTASPAAA